MRVISSLENFDVREADGFDEEDGDKKEHEDSEFSEDSTEEVDDDEVVLQNKAAPEQALLNEENNIKVEEPTKTLQ